MRIQHNIPAMNAYRNFGNNSKAINKNLEKLSSGYKINRAGDDAAGLAISEKMRAQITGLDVAQKNAKDGISLIQTAEGALTEVHDMLNRMVTLAEQSANGTYNSNVDREQLQKEVTSLKDEINRIGKSANFNGTKLLDGSLSGPTQSAGLAKATLTEAGDTGITDATVTSTDENLDGVVIRIAVDENGEWDITLREGTDVTTGEGEAATTASAAEVPVYTVDKEEIADGVITILNGDGEEAAKVNLEGFSSTVPESFSDVGFITLSIPSSNSSTNASAEDIDGGQTGIRNVKVSSTDTGLDDVQVTIGSNEAGDAWKVDLTDAQGNAVEGYTTSFDSEDPSTLVIKDDSGKNAATLKLVGFASDVTQAITNENSTEAGKPNAATFTLSIAEYTTNGSGHALTLQIGDTSDDFNKMSISVDAIDTNQLGRFKVDEEDGYKVLLDANGAVVKDPSVATATNPLTIADIDISTQEGAAAAMDVIKAAINYVSDTRGGLGALQNRLEHTINNLSVMQENMQDAESTIRDTDVAEEMMKYTKNNILVQSAQAMLAQANQLPQGVLQLLQ